MKVMHVLNSRIYSGAEKVVYGMCSRNMGEAARLLEKEKQP